MNIFGIEIKTNRYLDKNEVYLVSPITKEDLYRGKKANIPIITKYGDIGYLCKCGCGRVSNLPIDCSKVQKGKINE